MCSNSRARGCWNSFGAPCDLAGRQTMSSLTGILYELEGFDTQFRHEVEQAHRRAAGASDDDWRALDRDEAKLARDRRNLVDAITEYGPSPEFKRKHDELDGRKR